MRFLDLGTSAYRPTWAIQETAVEEVAVGGEERVFLVEHPPVITLGRRAGLEKNVLAGAAMGRRATYMYGALLPRGPKGHVDCGLGKAVSMGEVSLVPPTESITHTGQKISVDGIDIVFQVTPDTEAPVKAELTAVLAWRPGKL